MKFVLISIMAVAVLSLSVNSFAGNQANSAGGGNVTALVYCEEDDGFDVDEISVAVKSDACDCELEFDALSDLNCNKADASCADCLGTLKLHGMTITSVNALNNPTEELEGEDLFYHVLEGNAGVLIDRMGGCPCD